MKPKKGEFYKHDILKTIAIQGYSLDFETKEPLVIFKSFATGKSYTTKINKFLESEFSKVEVGFNEAEK